MQKAITSDHDHNMMHPNDHGDHHHDPQELKMLGFWLFLISDVILFACLFATYIVLRHSTAGGPSGAELFNISGVTLETFILLTSSFTSGLAVLSMNKKETKSLINWLIVTIVLGLMFIGLEIYEFIEMVHSGASYTTSAFTGAFFTLVGTHGLHVCFGIVWMVALIIQLYHRGVTDITKGKVMTISLYWHFLDVVWIFLFTIVYLMGVM